MFEQLEMAAMVEAIVALKKADWSVKALQDYYE